MAREYEVVYILDPTLEAAQVNELLERHHHLLVSPETANPVAHLDHWGKRMLAYSLKGREQGYFVVARLETQPHLLAEFERFLKLDEAVLRYLIVISEGMTEPVPGTEEADVNLAAPAEEGV